MKIKSAFWSVAKYVLAFILLIVILRHAQTDKIIGYIRKIPVPQLLWAFFLITLAQICSGLRMRFLFHRAGLAMHARYAIILFYVGAFYNFLLPGGIGGDAYKVILVRRRMNVSAKQGIRIMLADRASGLCILIFTLCAGLLTFDFSSLTAHASLLISAFAAVTLIGYLGGCRWLLRQSPLTMLGALPYSLAIQSLWAAALLTIWKALGTGAYAIEYIVLYCASSITAMLPISVGGLGIKEMTYYYGAQLLQRYAHSGVDGDLGVALSLCIFALLFASSLQGLLWLNKVEKGKF